MEVLALPLTENGLLRVRVEAEDIQPGKLPIRDLTRLGEMLQDGLERSARLISQERGIAPGPLPRLVHEATSLLLVGVEPGSAQLLLELPPPVETLDDEGRLLPLPPKDLGFRALERFVGGVEELEASESLSVPAGWDNSVMEVAESLAEFATERGYKLTLDARPPNLRSHVAHITPDIATKLRVRHVPIRRRRSVRGELILVDLRTGRIDVEDGSGRRVQCEFAPDRTDFVETVKRLVGQMVVVSGEEEVDLAVPKPGRLHVDVLEPAPEKVPLHELFWTNRSSTDQASEQSVAPISSIAEIARPDLFSEQDIESFVATIREARREE